MTYSNIGTGILAKGNHIWKEKCRMDYEEYEKQCKEIRAENDNLLKIFEEDLKSKGLSEQTIGRHISNVDFYINEYLLREDARTMEEGVAAIDTFLGYFFIRKCMWSTPGTIKSTAATLTLPIHFAGFERYFWQRGFPGNVSANMVLLFVGNGC